MRAIFSTNIGGKWAGALFVLVLLSFVAESQLTQYVQTDLGFRQPYFVFYLVHSSFSIMFPLHYVYLLLFSSMSARAIWDSLVFSLKRHIAYTILDKPTSFPAWGFVRLAFLMTIMMSIPALLWFIAITMAPLSDVTALWNTNAFFAYILTVKLYHLGWEVRRLASVLLATLGAAVVVYGGNSASAPEETRSSETARPPNPMIGDLLTLAAAIVYGIYQVLYKKYAALPSDPDAELDGLDRTTAYEVITDTDLEDPIDDRNDIAYPPPFALYANCLTTSIGLCTFFLLWIPIPIMHLTGVEEFHLPTNLTTVFAIAGISLSGVLFNAGLMVLLGMWGPIVTSVGNLLTIVLVFASDAIFGGAIQTVTVWSVFGCGSIVVAFTILALDLRKGSSSA